MSGLPRRRDVRLSRVNLQNMDEEQRWDLVERYINELREVALQRSTVLPIMTQSAQPQDGELLFTGSVLFLCVAGQYEQVWPAEAISIEGGESVSTTVTGLTYPNPRRTLKWSYRDDITPDDPGGTQAKFDLIEAVYVDGAYSTTKHICVVYLSITNPDCYDHTIRFFFEGDDVDDDPDFPRPHLTTSVPAMTTKVHNLNGAELIGPLGGTSDQGRFYCTADDDEGWDNMVGLTRNDLIVHVGYVELEENWVSFTDSRVKDDEQGNDCRDDWTDGVPPPWTPPTGQ